MRENAVKALLLGRDRQIDEKMPGFSVKISNMLKNSYRI